jgi:hypothetical protein
VDWKDGEFVSPSEQITPDMLSQIIDRNQTFLGYAQNSLKMLKRLDKSPEGLQDLVVEFVEAPDYSLVQRPILSDRQPEAALLWNDLGLHLILSSRVKEWRRRFSVGRQVLGTGHPAASASSAHTDE